MTSPSTRDAGRRAGYQIGAAVLRCPWLMNLSRRLGRIAFAVTPRFLIYNRWNAWGREREMPEIPKESFRELYRRRNRR